MHADGDVDYKAVAADIADIIKKDPDKGPTLVRLYSFYRMSRNYAMPIPMSVRYIILYCMFCKSQYQYTK